MIELRAGLLVSPFCIQNGKHIFVIVGMANVYDILH